MSVEIESAGAFVTASLAASSLPDAHGGDAHGACANCQTPLTGRYCSSCGQSGHIHHSLLHLCEEVLHGILHFDAKGWRTLPLLVARPGQLTRRYVDGQRTRFVSPLALFLFMIFLMFFVISATSTNDKINVLKPQTRATHRAELDADVIKANARVTNAQAQLAAVRAKNGDVEDAVDEEREARIEQRVATTLLSKFDARPAPAPDQTGAPSTDREGVTVDAGGFGKMADKLSKKGWLGEHPQIASALKHAADNPELTLYKLKNTAYKFSFLLVPISLPFMWLLLVGRRGVTMYDHAVFSLYSISFMSLLFVVVALAGYVGLETLTALLIFIVPPVHMFAQLRGTYLLSVWGALWRTVVLVAVAGTVFLLYLALIVVLTVH